MLAQTDRPSVKALLRETDLVCEIIRRWNAELSVPATVKIRILDDGGSLAEQRGLQGTMHLIDALEAAGASAITLHARTRMNKGIKTTAADWDALRAVKRRCTTIPIIGNGNIETPADVIRCLTYTGVDAVMSAEAALDYPALFADVRHQHELQHLHQHHDAAAAAASLSFRHSRWDLASEYLDIVDSLSHVKTSFRAVRTHVGRMLYGQMRRADKALRSNGSVMMMMMMTTDNDKDSSRGIASSSSSSEYFAGRLIDCATTADVRRFMSDLRSHHDHHHDDDDGDHALAALASTTAAEANASSASSAPAPDTWYRRHRDGVVTSERETRKTERRAWLDNGLRI